MFTHQLSKEANRGQRMMYSDGLMPKDDAPLPSELRKKVSEKFAALLLNYFYPGEFSGLDIGNERPDLQSEELGIGIEVTHSVPQESMKLDSIYCWKYIRGNKEEKEKARKRITEYFHGIIEEYFLIHPTRSRDLTVIYNSAIEKTKKLNENGFTLFRQNYLFIFSSELILDEELPEILLVLQKIMMGAYYSSDRVYLYCYGGHLYKFDLETNVFSFLDDDSSMPDNLAQSAEDYIRSRLCLHRPVSLR